MKTLISIDPGLSTGLIAGTYSEETPFKLTHVFQIEGGVEGFVKNVRVHHGEDWNLMNYATMHLPGKKSITLYQDEVYYHPGWDECEEDHMCPEQVRGNVATVLVEKFNARGSANAGFSYTSKSLEPLRVEGALIAMGLPITWTQPSQQYFLPGKDKAEKKKRQHAWLKENGYYIAPKDIGSSDADDARSATAHAISWLRRQKHKPTLDLFR